MLLYKKLDGRQKDVGKFREGVILFSDIDSLTHFVHFEGWKGLWWEPA